MVSQLAALKMARRLVTDGGFVYSPAADEFFRYQGVEFEEVVDSRRFRVFPIPDRKMIPLLADEMYFYGNRLVEQG